MAYLYGASVQGIQGFIFETNRLKDIVGASNLMEKFDSEKFIEKFIKKYSDEEIENIDILRNSGANIRILFTDEQEDLAKIFVKEFPRYIMQRAYGITISQAVEIYDKNYLQASQNLELSLKNARNKVAYPLDAKFALMKQASRSGKPAAREITYSGKTEDNEQVDIATCQKFKEAIPAHENLLLNKIGIDKADYAKFPFRFELMSNSKKKLAIIHADGNKMGVLLQKMAEKLKGKEVTEVQQAFKDFSNAIVTSTNEAVKKAFESQFKIENYSANLSDDNKIPFRPLIIGGDDLTVVCHADKALDFVTEYMKNFQENTKEEFKKESLQNIIKDIEGKDKDKDKDIIKAFTYGLTACAGIANCNEKFPFHYAVDVAGALCDMAKKASDREASCLLFHNIHGSAFTSFEAYVEKELTINNVSLLYGPYYINEETDKDPQLSNLMALHEVFTQEDFPTAKLREWLSTLHISPEQADNYLSRLKYIADKDNKIDTESIKTALKALDNELTLSNFIANGKTPIHDILQLKSVQGGK